ncbi:MAG TPA: phage baseplate assembly protein V [Anaerolineales bacterium]|nr:phage baseplate assembly protein V [Anaerolineales bacterium]
MLQQQKYPSGPAGSPDGRYFGVHTALVTDIVDPDQQGRVKIRLPWSPDPGGGLYEAWARPATLMAGNNRGTWFIPDVDDEVLVVFEAGDPRRPYVIGALWNGQDAPPETMDGAGSNNRKTIRSRNGLRISLDDRNGQESLTLETPGGQKVVLKDGPGAIEAVDSNGNEIRLETGGVTVTAAAKVTVNATVVEVSAAMLTVNAGLAKFSGVVQADTVITNSVISSSYTPGAGNIW